MHLSAVGSTGQLDRQEPLELLEQSEGFIGLLKDDLIICGGQRAQREIDDLGTCTDIIVKALLNLGS